jgi:hypothetical protein
VNPYGHGPLVYDFSINVTVPPEGRAEVSFGTVGGQNSGSR